MTPQRSNLRYLRVSDMREAEMREAVRLATESIEREQRAKRRHTLAVLGMLALMFAASAVGMWLVSRGAPGGALTP
jgi:hypothetical protein